MINPEAYAVGECGAETRPKRYKKGPPQGGPFALHSVDPVDRDVFHAVGIEFGQIFLHPFVQLVIHAGIRIAEIARASSSARMSKNTASS